jgi:hypothetical protein
MYRKPFGQIEEGDTIYSLSHHQATIRIFKHTVTSVKECVKGVSVVIRFGENGRICQNIKETRYYESGFFWSYAVTTTLEEAKEICKEMAKKRIDSIKKEKKSLENKLLKWKNFEKDLNEGIFIVK